MIHYQPIEKLTPFFKEIVFIIENYSVYASQIANELTFLTENIDGCPTGRIDYA